MRVGFDHIKTHLPPQHRIHCSTSKIPEEISFPKTPLERLDSKTRTWSSALEIAILFQILVKSNLINYALGHERLRTHVQRWH